VNGRLWQRLLGLERRRAAAPPGGTPRLPWDAIADGSAAGDPEWAWLFTPTGVCDPTEERINGDNANHPPAGDMKVTVPSLAPRGPAGGGERVPRGAGR
jgi:hypothetical protein